MSVAEISRQKKRAEALAKKRAERENQIKQQLTGWFELFDTDGNGVLDREELRALLTHLQPNHPPTDVALDFLIEKATAIDTYSMHIKGDRNGTISWDATKETVVRYRDYVRDQVWIDAVFTKHDIDGSGELEAPELLPLLRELAPDADVTEGDVRYVLNECDADGNGAVSREELLPMVSSWRSLVQDKNHREIVEKTTRLWQAGQKVAQGGGAAVQMFAAKMAEKRAALAKANAAASTANLLGHKPAIAPKAKLHGKLRLAAAVVQAGKSDRVDVEGSTGGNNHAADGAGPPVAVVPAPTADAPSEDAAQRSAEAGGNGSDSIVSKSGGGGSSACVIL